MLRGFLLALLLLPLSLAPLAGAAPPTCASVTRSGATPYGPYAVSSAPQTYQVWLETNMLEGLQSLECLGADGRVVAPDRYVTTVGAGGSQPVCVPRVGCIWI